MGKKAETYWLRCVLILALSLSYVSNSQAQTYAQLVDFADQKVVEKDYYYALTYYKKAMDLDSNSVEIIWKYAEALRLYKDYPNAEIYYAKVFKKEDAKIYARSIYWLASMQYLNGKYTVSLDNWKRAKKVYKKDRDSYEYLKSQQMIKNCLWAKKAVLDTSDFIVEALPAPVNSPNTEFAPVIHNNKLYFTSLQADSINFSEEIFTSEYSIQIYSAAQEDSIFNNVGLVNDLVEKGFNTANGSFSPDGKRFYFSRCNTSYECKIFVGRVDGDKIKDIDSLGDIINEPGYIATMPHCAQVGEYEVLFYASNVKHNYGGLDLWYSVIKDGNKYTLPKSLGPDINTLDDEITPFYDTVENKLYFSSSWYPGFGGQDVFWAKNVNFQFKDPQNAGIPINSTKNDTYLIKDYKDETFYFSSNREGVQFAKNPTCCNDIFTAKLPKVIVPPGKYQSLEDLNKHLPVKLYFHNDEPNPKTTDTVSTLTYIQSYNQYIKLKSDYKKEYSKGLVGDDSEEAKEDIDDFFVQYVEQGVLDLKEFLRLLLPELQKGFEIEVTIKGFASPLAKTDYNIHLTKRRISSLLNYLAIYEDGVLKPYLNHSSADGGSLSFVKIPFGEYTADQLISDNPNDAQNSIYSRKAGLERKIEIQSVSLVTKDSTYAKMIFEKQTHDFGASAKGDILTYEFKFKNEGEEVLEIGDVTSDCECLTFTVDQSTVQPGESGTISIKWDTKAKSGISFSRLRVESNIKGGVKELTLTSEIK